MNCAASTAVDLADVEEARAFVVSAVGAANVARSAWRARARLVHIATDHVFDGVAQSPYAEDTPTAPRSAYGRNTSKESVRSAPRPAFPVLGHGTLDEIGVAPVGDWDQRWAAAAEEVLT